MYNKLFTKILDSSIWLEPSPTRIVWVTCLAAMDETGFVQFASPANLAHRANVTLDDALVALERLEGPDENSSDPDHEGRRLERVQGGWMVLNAGKYRGLVKRILQQEQIRLRVAAFRARKRASNAPVTVANASVTPSEADTETKSETKTAAKGKNFGAVAPSSAFLRFWAIYPKKKAKGAAMKAWNRLKPDESLVTAILAAVEKQIASADWQRDGGQFVPFPATWLNGARWLDEAEPEPIWESVSPQTRQNLAARERAMARIKEAQS